ncbi:hypothetical protein F5H01DRAFT_375106, partial [Linnemannia elongata]
HLFVFHFLHSLVRGHFPFATALSFFPIAVTTSSISSIVFDGLARHSSFHTTHSLFLICRILFTSFSFLFFLFAVGQNPPSLFFCFAT